MAGWLILLLLFGVVKLPSVNPVSPHYRILLSAFILAYINVSGIVI